MANVLFVPPVISLKHNLVARLKDTWDKACLVFENRASKITKEKLNFIIDKLFDLVDFNCIISLCSEQCYPPDCKAGATLTVPVLEREKYQLMNWFI